MATNRKAQHPQQLELRVFGDIGARARPSGKDMPSTQSVTKVAPQSSKGDDAQGGATERDKAIYLSIASRYFEL
ncbi:MAG: hypothetical protein RSP_05440 [Rhodanobacter sp.]